VGVCMFGNTFIFCGLCSVMGVCLYVYNFDAATSAPTRATAHNCEIHPSHRDAAKRLIEEDCAAHVQAVEWAGQLRGQWLRRSQKPSRNQSYMYNHLQTYKYICRNECICITTCILIFICIYAYMHGMCITVDVCMYICIYMYVCIYIYMYIKMYKKCIHLNA